MIEREEVKTLLQDWLVGGKTELEVWQWAEQAKETGQPGDNLVRDLIDTLATLPFDMITPDDVPVLMDALNNPVSETDLSINLLWNHLDGIDTDGRRHVLKDHPFYGQFCDGMS